MSALKKWTELHRIYKKAQRPQIIRDLFLQNSLWRALSYWATVLAYIGGSCGLYFVFSGSGWALGGIVVLAAIVHAVIEKLIERDYSNLYTNYGLRSMPLFRRSRYLTYLRFVEYANRSSVLSVNDVDILVKWNNVRRENITSLSYFLNPIVLIVLTTLSGLFVEMLKEYQWITPGRVGAIVFIGIVMIWLGWIIFDFSNSYMKKTIDMCRYLNWWQIECASEQS